MISRPSHDPFAVSSAPIFAQPASTAITLLNRPASGRNALICVTTLFLCRALEMNEVIGALIKISFNQLSLIHVWTAAV
jgi:hypothetical protein